MCIAFQENKDPSLKALLRWMPMNASLGGPSQNEEMWGDENEVFHNSTNAFPVTTALCGEIYRNYHEVSRSGGVSCELSVM